MEGPAVGTVRRAAWWLAPLTAVWLFGMWMVTLYVRAGEPVWAVVVMLAGNIITFGVSALIGIRRPEVRVGQLLTLATAGFAISPFLLEEIEPFMAAWVVDLVIVAGAPMGMVALASVSWVILLFPDGHHLSRRWRWVSWLLGGLVAIGAPLTTAWFLSEEVESAIPALDDIIFAVVMVPFLAALASLFFRYRVGTIEVRAQLRWLLYGVSAYALFLVVGLSNLENTIVSAALDQIFYLGIPIGIGVAIFRYRLYEIDRLISRTVTYAIVVGLLAAAFLGMVTLVTAVLPTQDSLAVATSTLAVAALFNPLRRRVHTWVDRRFNRSRYDAQTIVDRFVEDLMRHSNTEDLAGALTGVIEQTLEPRTVGVWIASDRT